MKPFPVPVIAADLPGPGSHLEVDTLDYMSMPQGMDTYRAPVLPEPHELSARRAAHRVLRETLAALDAVRRGGATQTIDLTGLDAEDLALINKVMGEGEVSARVLGEDGVQDAARIQESVFAGVWRVMRFEHGLRVLDTLEVGAVPDLLYQAARDDVRGPTAAHLPSQLPPDVVNAPLLLGEIEDQWQRWRPGMPPHVVNLTLLPMSVADISFLDHQLGTGRVLILSRGYGNCRITNTCMPTCWRVVYYNSQDAVILNTVEVIDLPEVACAAPVDLHDSHERLHEVLQWVEGALEEVLT